MGRAESDPEPSATSYYDRLGVPTTADAETIDEAGKRVKSKYHPDRHRGTDDARERWDRIKSAERVLTDETDRQAYDTFLDRFGAEEGTRAFETWVARSRPEPPDEWDPQGDTPSSEPSTADTDTSRSSSDATAGTDTAQAAESASETRSDATSTADTTASTSSRQTAPSTASTDGSAARAAGSGSDSAASSAAGSSPAASTGTNTSTAPTGATTATRSGRDRWSFSRKDKTVAFYCALYLAAFGLLIVISDAVRLPVTVEALAVIRAQSSRLLALSLYGDVDTLAAATGGLTVFTLAFGGVLIRLRPYYVHEIDRKVWKETGRTVGFAVVAAAAVGALAAGSEFVPTTGFDVGSVAAVPSGSTPVVIGWLIAALCAVLLGLLVIYWAVLFVSLSYVGLALVIGLFLNRTFDIHGLRPALVSGALFVSVLTVVPIAPVLALLTGGAVLSIFYDANLS
jgi:curved DNA-binding protein CbpA